MTFIDIQQEFLACYQDMEAPWGMPPITGYITLMVLCAMSKVVL